MKHTRGLKFNERIFPMLMAFACNGDPSVSLAEITHRYGYVNHGGSVVITVLYNLKWVMRAGKKGYVWTGPKVIDDATVGLFCDTYRELGRVRSTAKKSSVTTAPAECLASALVQDPAPSEKDSTLSSTVELPTEPEKVLEVPVPNDVENVSTTREKLKDDPVEEFVRSTKNLVQSLRQECNRGSAAAIEEIERRISDVEANALSLYEMLSEIEEVQRRTRDMCETIYYTLQENASVNAKDLVSKVESVLTETVPAKPLPKPMRVLVAGILKSQATNVERRVSEAYAKQGLTPPALFFVISDTLPRSRDLPRGIDAVVVSHWVSHKLTEVINPCSAPIKMAHGITSIVGLITDLSWAINSR